MKYDIFMDNVLFMLPRSLSNKLKKVGKKQNVEENLTSTASTSSDLRPLLVSGQLEQRLTEIQTIESFSQRCDHCKYIRIKFIFVGCGFINQCM